jgi:hypothetical protein
VRGDYFEYILNPVKGVDAMKFAGSHQRVQHGATLGGFMAPGEQVIFSADFMHSFT